MNEYRFEDEDGKVRLITPSNQDGDYYVECSHLISDESAHRMLSELQSILIAKDNNLLLEVESESKDLFCKFWKAYPRKVGKAICERKFKSLKVDDAILGKMLSAIEYQVKSGEWTADKWKFIPHPHTWLNQGRWMDEHPELPKQSTPNPVKREPTQDELDGESLVHAILENKLDKALEIKSKASANVIRYANYKLNLEQRNILAKLGK